MWEDLITYPEEIVKTICLNDDGGPLVLTSYQKQFLKDIIVKKYDKYFFCAATRSGKSEVIAVSALLLALIYPHEDIAVVSFTWAQSQIIFNKIRKHITSNPFLMKFIDKTNEFSRQEINFANGSKVKCLSVGGANKGESALGFGATILIIDESGSIDDETYYTKVLRMIAAGRTRRIVIESGTPHRKNHFYEAHNNPIYKKYKVTWREAVKEGQMSEKEVIEIKARISDIEFRMWYEAEFPEEAEDSLFNYKDVLEAQEKQFNEDKGILVLGVDVARFGADFTVLTEVLITANEEYVIKKIYVLDEVKKLDTVEVTKAIEQLSIKNKYKRINVDVIGVGSGVFDGLNKLYHKGKLKAQVIDCHFGEGCEDEDEKKIYLNKKAKYYSDLAKLFENKKISIPKDKRLIDQLLAMRFQFTTNGRKQIIDPDKSPDFADSLVYSVWYEKTKFILDW